jgi:hypothetical protein
MRLPSGVEEVGHTGWLERDTSEDIAWLTPVEARLKVAARSRALILLFIGPSDCGRVIIRFVETLARQRNATIGAINDCRLGRWPEGVPGRSPGDPMRISRMLKLSSNRLGEAANPNPEGFRGKSKEAPIIKFQMASSSSRRRLLKIGFRPYCHKAREGLSRRFRASANGLRAQTAVFKKGILCQRQ